jgi:hypothetical protein
MMLNRHLFRALHTVLLTKYGYFKEIFKILSRKDKESTIVEELTHALQDMRDTYVLPFRFRNDEGTRTTHHLIFVSKHFRGFEIMRDIMAGKSSKKIQGVATFEHNPADIRQPRLFELSRPLDDLEEVLLHDYAGCCISSEEIYKKHSIGKFYFYVEKNYKEALRNLEAQGRIISNIPPEKRLKRNGAVSVNNVLFRFPDL